eukprot:m.160623 g.160623  ORF g.160623 m.160623 type:complete len:500 (-) comp23801_c0_seq1:36-1535(-)
MATPAPRSAASAPPPLTFMDSAACDDSRPKSVGNHNFPPDVTNLDSPSAMDMLQMVAGAAGPTAKRPRVSGTNSAGIPPSPSPSASAPQISPLGPGTHEGFQRGKVEPSARDNQFVFHGAHPYHPQFEGQHQPPQPGAAQWHQMTMHERQMLTSLNSMMETPQQCYINPAAVMGASMGQVPHHPHDPHSQHALPMMQDEYGRWVPFLPHQLPVGHPGHPVHPAMAMAAPPYHRQQQMHEAPPSPVYSRDGRMMQSQEGRVNRQAMMMPSNWKGQSWPPPEQHQQHQQQYPHQQQHQPPTMAAAEHSMSASTGPNVFYGLPTPLGSAGPGPHTYTPQPMPAAGGERHRGYSSSTSPSVPRSDPVAASTVGGPLKKPATKRKVKEMKILNKFDLIPRDEKSMQFNLLEVGVTVRIRKNKRPGHHDVTREAELVGQLGVIVAKPTWPSTWLTVRLVENGVPVKVRSSNIEVVSVLDDPKPVVPCKAEPGVIDHPAPPPSTAT